MRRVAVVGAGAAGSMAAIFAASADAQTLLLERTPEGGRKILISGGGRCNILPARVEESRFVTESSPHTLRRMLRSWPLADQIAFFERELRLSLVEETETGKLFPASNRAKDVRDGLLSLAARRGASVAMNALVTGLTPRGGVWQVERADAPPLEVDAVVLASGGLSVPKTGSDGTGFSILEKLGHTIHPLYAALTPLLAPPNPFSPLAGVSANVALTARAGRLRASATGGFLFTHRGYSGPAVLDISHVAVRAMEASAADSAARVLVRWTHLDERAWEAALSPDGSRTVLSALRRELPERLALALLATAVVEAATALTRLRRADRLRLLETLVRGELPWNGHEGFPKAEVTGGGVSLAEVDPRTMESKLHPGLFLCGELLDAFGPIGGYNFQWAWATGRAAGLGAAGSDQP
ncbi:MAG: aminoacetone oxidase family FAD-binding enzyme [Acidobacteriota bacterium]